MAIWQRPISLTLLNERGLTSMPAHLGIEFTEIKDDALIAKMPVDYRTLQPAGILHGGASCVLAESVGSTAANFCVTEGHWCVGLDINTNHIRAKKSGFVFAIAKPFHIGKTTQVWGIDLYDEENKTIAVSRLTMAVLQAN